MAIIKNEDVICWRNDSGSRPGFSKVGSIACNDCADTDQDTPLTSNDIDEEDIVICDICKRRMQ